MQILIEKWIFLDSQHSLILLPAEGSSPSRMIGTASLNVRASRQVAIGRIAKKLGCKAKVLQGRSGETGLGSPSMVRYSFVEASCSRR